MPTEVRKKKTPYRVSKGEPGPDLHKCLPCGYVYDDSRMDVRFRELGESYRCPLCSARLDAFVKTGIGG